jgi:hypothetical protein
MYETDIFVEFKFRFIGMQNFITNEAQIVTTLSHTKRTQTYTRRSIEHYLTSKDSFINCLHNLYSICKIFICQNFRHPKSTDTTHINLDHGIYIYIFAYVVFEIQHFRQFHEMFVTHHCQSRHERHFYSAVISVFIVFLQVLRWSSKLSFLHVLSENLPCHLNTNIYICNCFLLHRYICASRSGSRMEDLKATTVYVNSFLKSWWCLLPKIIQTNHEKWPADNHGDWELRQRCIKNQINK